MNKKAFTVLIALILILLVFLTSVTLPKIAGDITGRVVLQAGGYSFIERLYFFLRGTLCSDSDGGINVYTFGATKDSGESSSDQCSSSRMLQESYCSKNEVSVHSYDCQYGCSAGACVKQF